MNTRRIVSDKLLPPGATDREAEAKKHPGMVNGFTHWSSPGWDEERQVAVITLTFDPDCPRCKDLNLK